MKRSGSESDVRALGIAGDVGHQDIAQHMRRSLEAAATRVTPPSLEEGRNTAASSRRGNGSKGQAIEANIAKSARNILDVQEMQRMSKQLIELCTEAKHNKQEIAELNRFVKILPFDQMEVIASLGPTLGIESLLN
jgi:hypothetical protein